MALIDDALAPAAGRVRSARPLRRLASSLGAAEYAALAVLLLVVLWLVVPGLFSPYDPLAAAEGAKALEAPSPAHPFGTDHLARDLLSRVIWGSRESLSIASSTLGIGLLGGIVLGTLAAVGPRATTTLALLVIDALLAVPGFLVALILVTLVSSGPSMIALGLGVGAIPGFARVTRSELLRVRELEFVEAARLSGESRLAIVAEHVLPNAAGPVLAMALVEVGGIVLSISALGFLGYGSPPPTPEWGLLVAEGRDFLGSAWWYSCLPGFVVIVIVTAFGVIGRSALHATRV